MYTAALLLTVTLCLLPRATPLSDCDLCGVIKSNLPDSPTGYYTITGGNGPVYQAYCYMDTLCGSDGGWTRVAYLDMSDTTQQCPDTLSLFEENGVRVCGRPTGSASCASVTFASTLSSYTEVCGRVIGYQYGTHGGINPYGHNDDIDGQYVDGVSITQGSSRQHIWTFITARNEESDTASDNRHMCPCEYDETVPDIPSFVGDDWFCESGSSAETTVDGEYYTSDPLWDGGQCGSLESCCDTAGQPWFHKTLDSPTSDYLELRVCENNGVSSPGVKDSPVALYEIYIK